MEDDWNCIHDTTKTQEMQKNETYAKKDTNDYNTRFQYISSLITSNELEKAQEEIKILYYDYTHDSSFSKNYSQKNLLQYNILLSNIRIAFLKEDYQTAYDTCWRNTHLLGNSKSHILLLYCQYKLGMNNLENRDSKDYIIRQIIEYKEDDLLNYIKSHNVILNKKFLNQIKKYIPNSKKISPSFFEDVYYFKYKSPDKETNKGEIFYKVTCFHNTKNIIDIEPLKQVGNVFYNDLTHLNSSHLK